MRIRYHIWVSGTRDFETVFPVRCLGEGYGSTFREACLDFFERNPAPDFDSENLSVWQGKLYPSRHEAESDTPYPEAHER